MAKQKRKKQKSADELNSENEFLKLKMMAEFGGEFVGSDSIPPDIENAFLKHIEKIQRAHAVAVKMPLYEFLEKPEYSHVHDLSDKSIKKELKRLLKIMGKKGVSLVSLSNVGNKELYRFLTEELFKKEVENVKLKGWKVQFIYEDFHPNHQFDIERTVHDALLIMIDKNNPPYQLVFDEDMHDKLGLQIDFEDWIQQLKTWHETFNKGRLEDVDFVHEEINDELNRAIVQCEVTYGIQPAKGKRFKLTRFPIEFWLTKKEGVNWWTVNRVNLDWA